jgi:arginyl-tRNA synthetase
MNLFIDYQEKITNFLKDLMAIGAINLPTQIPKVTVELPPKGVDADISCNVAMLLAKYNNMSPLDLAKIIKKTILEKFVEFENIEISKQGFLNIKLTINFWQIYLSEIIKSKSNYGSDKEYKKKYIVEFVSANPTGPLHVGHCRGAILGDTISNLLKFNGNFVTKEYYVNDYGNQIKNFVKSVYFRIIELTDKKIFTNTGDLYPGEYIIDIAKNIIKKKNIKNFSDFNSIYQQLEKESLEISIKMIKKNLELIGVKHNNFVYESNLIKDNLVSKVIKILEKKNLVYSGKLQAPKGESNKNWKSRSQLLFKSSNFGDDTDRALQKIDGDWTYFASDISYHAYKINRNFDNLINILGADHSGYIKRITAATNALSDNKKNLICKVSQLVKLFKDGKPFKMSKRAGDYITVDDLVNEVGKDSVRFMMLSRSNDVELDFDFKKVTEKSKDNPVYYVQYAYARINSIFRALNIKLNDEIKISDKDFLLNTHEIQILKKISEWPKCVEVATKKLEPHRIPFYLYDLVTLFHSYWNLGSSNKEFRFVSETSKFNNSRLVLLQALAIVIENGMSILGVSTPSSM